MAFNPDRFVIIDGVQVSKTRALREGLIDEKGRLVKREGDSSPAGPSSTRARSSASTRRGSGGKTKATADDDVTVPADDDDDAAADDAAEDS